nr:MAG TPA: hypothetical protein [Caudoviricetes sp.]
MATLDLDALLAQKKEANGGVSPDRVAFTFAGETFTFLDPALADDKDLGTFEQLGNDPVETAKAYMGAAEYKRFRSLGGRASYFLLIFTEFYKRTTERIEGKS